MKTTTAVTWPDDWDTVLDTAIRDEGGEWTPARVRELFLARYGRHIGRADARLFLSQRAHAGVLTLHHRPNARYYTLKAGA